METTNNIQTPVLFLIYNRPKHTQKVFETIRKAKPAKLFIAADGANPNKPDDELKCLQAREIIKSIDWECELYLRFLNENRGCKVAVSSAIDWFFGNVEQGIILEDDCIPHESFFTYCDVLLDKYKDDEEVGCINSVNFMSTANDTASTYYFTKFPQVWGWATWRRAWKRYDVNMKNFPDFLKKNLISKYARTKNEQIHWLEKFERVSQGKIDTWDYQWLFAHWYYDMKAIAPSHNITSNIGFDLDATHTKKPSTKFSYRPVSAVVNITHPAQHSRDDKADQLLYDSIYRRHTLYYMYARLKIIKSRWAQTPEPKVSQTALYAQ
ncbi:MAG: hypothetical protein KKA07_17210 [Bacteroidetes bacterium]|nr:hypothetical protein [Bacteroidota bacterium]MBU1720808.1 hypothetical protein [Bacteroidota bacterium]